ncbi:hypothetical protein GF322_04775 [Candidatus Dependentiae bacterium]|nr:hypothetical protein [Candidatus Dependentiae bacterium]
MNKKFLFKNLIFILFFSYIFNFYFAKAEQIMTDYNSPQVDLEDEIETSSTFIGEVAPTKPEEETLLTTPPKEQAQTWRSHSKPLPPTPRPRPNEKQMPAGRLYSTPLPVAPQTPDDEEQAQTPSPTSDNTEQAQPTSPTLDIVQTPSEEQSISSLPKERQKWEEIKQQAREKAQIAKEAAKEAIDPEKWKKVRQQTREKAQIAKEAAKEAADQGAEFVEIGAEFKSMFRKPSSQEQPSTQEMQNLQEISRQPIKYQDPVYLYFKYWKEEAKPSYINYQGGLLGTIQQPQPSSRFVFLDPKDKNSNKEILSGNVVILYNPTTSSYIKIGNKKGVEVVKLGSFPAQDESFQWHIFDLKQIDKKKLTEMGKKFLKNKISGLPIGGVISDQSIVAIGNFSVRSKPDNEYRWLRLPRKGWSKNPKQYLELQKHVKDQETLVIDKITLPTLPPRPEEEIPIKPKEETPPPLPARPGEEQVSPPGIVTPSPKPPSMDVTPPPLPPRIEEEIKVEEETEKKHEVIPPPPPPPAPPLPQLQQETSEMKKNGDSSSGRAALLESIRAGQKLKPVSQREKEEAKKEKSTPEEKRGLMESLAAAMEKRRGSISEEEEEIQEEEDEEEWQD